MLMMGTCELQSSLSMKCANKKSRKRNNTFFTNFHMNLVKINFKKKCQSNVTAFM